MHNLSEPLQRFKSFLETTRYAAHHTIRGYLADLRQLEEHLVGEGLTLLTATSAAINKHQELLARRLSPVTRARHLSSIKQFYRYLVSEQLLVASPAKLARRPKMPRPATRQVPAVRQVLRVLEQPPERCRLGVRDRAILEVLYGAGIRVAELAGMDLLSVDVQARSLHVVGKGGRERYCPINAHALRVLQQYLARRGEFTSGRGTQHPTALFLSDRGTRLTTAQIRRRVKLAASAAGLELTPHGFRHAFATHLLHRGAKVQDIQEMLGHLHVSTTQRYAHLSPEYVEGQYRTLHPRAGAASSTSSSESPSGARGKPHARTRSSAATPVHHRADPTRRAKSGGAYRGSHSRGVGTRKVHFSR